MILEDSVNYVYLMNVLKALISKAHTLLTLDHLLPHLPQTVMSPTFFDDFRTYCNTEEWLTFMQNYVSCSGGGGGGIVLNTFFDKWMMERLHRG